MTGIKKAETKSAHFENDAKMTDATEVAIRDSKKKWKKWRRSKRKCRRRLRAEKRMAREGNQYCWRGRQRCLHSTRMHHCRRSVRMLTTDPKMWDFMEYEIFHFNTTFEIHLEVIEMNIQKIKKTSNTSDLLPLPPYPKITGQFQIALEHLGALPRVAVHHEASDDPEMNCYICRNDYENEDLVLICKPCKKPVYQTCWMKWTINKSKQRIRHVVYAEDQ